MIKITFHAEIWHSFQSGVICHTPLHYISAVSNTQQPRLIKEKPMVNLPLNSESFMKNYRPSETLEN